MNGPCSICEFCCTILLLNLNLQEVVPRCVWPHRPYRSETPATGGDSRPMVDSAGSQLLSEVLQSMSATGHQCYRPGVTSFGDRVGCVAESLSGSWPQSLVQLTSSSMIPRPRVLASLIPRHPLDAKPTSQRSPGLFRLCPSVWTILAPCRPSDGRHWTLSSPALLGQETGSLAL